MPINHLPNNHEATRIFFLALVTLGGICISSVFILALHLLSPELDPVRRAMSDYVHSRFGLLMVSALVIMALSLLTLADAFRRIVTSTQQQLGVTLLAIAGVSLMIASVFPTDNTSDGSFTTVPGAIHAIASFLFSPLLVTAILCLLDPFNPAVDNSALRYMALASAVLSALAFAALLIVNIVVHLPFGGLGQRIFMGLVCSWLLLATIRLLIISKALQA